MKKREKIRAVFDDLILFVTIGCKNINESNVECIVLYSYPLCFYCLMETYLLNLTGDLLFMRTHIVLDIQIRSFSLHTGHNVRTYTFNLDTTSNLLLYKTYSKHSCCHTKRLKTNVSWLIHF